MARRLPRVLGRAPHKSLGIGTRLFEFCLGQNLCVFTGRVTRVPLPIKSRDDGLAAWMRMCVPNQDNHKQRLFLSVRISGALAQHAIDNVQDDDVVAVVGRLWTKKRRVRGTDGTVERPFQYLEAERLSSNYPVQLDRDPRFVRVRHDLWNRVASLVGRDDLMEIPEDKRAELLKLFGQMAGETEELDNVGPAEDDPTETPRPKDLE